MESIRAALNGRGLDWPRLSAALLALAIVASACGPGTDDPDETQAFADDGVASGCVQPPRDLVAWWTFDDEADTHVDLVDDLELDPAPSGVSSTAGSSVLSVNAIVNSGVEVGASYLAGVEPITMLDGVGDFTIDAWINPNDGTMPILDTRASRDETEGLLLRLRDGQLLLQLNSGNNKHINLESTGTVPPNTWSLVAVSVDRDGDTSFTINGKNSGTVLSALPNADINPGRLAIGRDVYSETGRGGGLIDELEVFSRALADDEIAALHSAGTNGKCRSEPTCSIDEAGTVALGTTVTATVTGAPQDANYEWDMGGQIYTGSVSPTQSHEVWNPNSNTFTVIWTANGSSGELQCGNLEMTSCVSPPDDLVAWWTFDEPVGPFVDQIAGLRAAAGSGSMSSLPGHIGRAVDMGADYLNVPSGLGLDAEDFTIDAWVKLDTDRLIIASSRRAQDQRGFLFMVYNGQLLLQLNTGLAHQNTLSEAATRVPLGQWSLVSVSVDRDGETRFTIDGVPVGATSTPHGEADVTTGEINIGYDEVNRVDGGGKIDELEIFDRALPDDEIGMLFKADVNGKCRSELSPNCTINPASGATLRVGDTVIATASGLPTGAAVEFDFGEKKYSNVTSSSQSHTYIKPGGYQIALTWSFQGQTGRTRCGVAEAVLGDLSCLFEPATPFAPGQQFQVELTSGAVAAWDMGDSTTLLGSSVSHSYTNSGTFLINIVANDDREVSCQVTVVGDEQPDVQCSAEPTAAEVGEPFSINLVEIPSTGLTYEVDLGDGTIVSGLAGQIGHTYHAAGTYTIKYRSRLNGMWSSWMRCDGFSAIKTPIDFEAICITEGWDEIGRDVSEPSDGEPDFVVEPGQTVAFTADISPSNNNIQVTWTFNEIQGSGAVHPDKTGQTATVTLPVGWWNVQATVVFDGDSETVLCPGTYIVNDG